MRLLLLPAALIVLAVTPANAQNRASRPVPVPAACVDFQAHSNHVWLQANPASPAQPERSRLAQMNAEAEQRQTALLDAAIRAPQNDLERVLGAFWAAGTNEAALEARSAAAVQKLLAPLGQLRRARDLSKVSADFHAMGLSPMVEFVRLDSANGSRDLIGAVPAPLGLGDPAFYTSTDTEVRTLLGKYRSYVEAVLRASGLPEAEVTPASEAILQIEIQLATALAGEAASSRSDDTLRAQDRRYIALGFSDLLKRLGSDTTNLVIVRPAYFATLSQIAADRDPRRLQWYLRFRVLNRLAPELGNAFRSAHSGFFAQTLQGRPAAPTRTEHMNILLRRHLGAVNDAAFTARYAPEAQRSRAESVASAVQKAAVDMATRAGDAAAAKAFSNARIAIAEVPASSDDVSGLTTLAADDHVGNLLTLWARRETRTLKNLPLAVEANPARLPTVRWSPNDATLIVSAASLAPPLLAEGATVASAADFGGFGALIGHELSKAAAAGNRGAALGPLFNGLQPAPGLRVDGARTLPMNRADLAGIEFAWAAFQTTHPQADANAKKAFFTAWAGLWAKTQTVEAMRQEIQTSPFAPSTLRINTVLTQTPAFAETYGCRAGQAMRAANPIAVWR